LEFTWVEWSIFFCGGKETPTYRTHVFFWLFCFLDDLFSGIIEETFPLFGVEVPLFDDCMRLETLETIRGQAFRGMYSCVRDLLPTSELVSMFRILMSLA